MSSLLVLSRYTPESLKVNEETGKPDIGRVEERNDSFDDFNHPRMRRACILEKLKSDSSSACQFEFAAPKAPTSDLSVYADNGVCAKLLVDFLSRAWGRWDSLGVGGQDPGSSMHWVEELTEGVVGSKPLVPGNFALPRDTYQRPSQSVMGQMGYYCTDKCTPIFSDLRDELAWDAATIQEAVRSALVKTASADNDSSFPYTYRGIYALCTHPGHHAAHDSFGGYCYLNHAALAARLLQKGLGKKNAKVAILDVDYHCGNGTASIFYKNPNVLVISIHCHPDYEYPFHSGFADETGAAEGAGSTLHIPLMPGCAWPEYKVALESAMERVHEDFGADALVVSLGLDTHNGDPCSIRRAGFRLEGTDYFELGKCIAGSKQIPTVWVQEGGYFMDKVPGAVSQTLRGFLDG